MAFELIDREKAVEITIGIDPGTKVCVYPLCVSEYGDAQTLVNTDNPMQTDVVRLANFMAPKIKSIEGIEGDITADVLLSFKRLNDLLLLVTGVIKHASVTGVRSKNSDSLSASPGKAAGEPTKTAE